METECTYYNHHRTISHPRRVKSRVYQHESQSVQNYRPRKKSIKSRASELDQIAKAARAMAPAAATADLGVRMLEALLPVAEGLAPLPVAVEVPLPDEPDEPELDPELLELEELEGGAGAVPLGFTVKELLLAKTWVRLEPLTICRM